MKQLSLDLNWRVVPKRHCWRLESHYRGRWEFAGDFTHLEFALYHFVVARSKRSDTSRVEELLAFEKSLISQLHTVAQEMKERSGES